LRARKRTHFAAALLVISRSSPVFTMRTQGGGRARRPAQHLLTRLESQSRTSSTARARIQLTTLAEKRQRAKVLSSMTSHVPHAS
jgi:hypothetical protein